MTKPMWQRKRFWFGLAVTLVFLYLVFRQVDLAALGQAMANADYRWLVPALAVYLLGYMFRAVRWSYLMASIKAMSWQELLPHLILGFMMNNVLPARAGEFVRAYTLGQQERISKSAVFATVVMQRVYDGLVMVLFAVLVLYGYQIPETALNQDFVHLMNWVINLTAGLFAFIFIVLFLAITWRERFVRGFVFFIRRLPARLSQPAERMLHGFLDGVSVLRSRRDSWLAFSYSLLAWTGESLAYYFILRAFGLAVPLHAALMLMAVVNLGIMLPSSPGYIGPFEFFGVGTLLLFGVAREASLPAVLVIHSVVWLPITLWGFYYMWTMKLSFREMKSAGEEKPVAQNPLEEK